MLGIAAIPYGVQRYSRVPPLATLTIDSTPTGRDVVVDGIARGATPATVTVAQGDHLVVVGQGASKVTLPLTARAGEHVRQNVVFETTVLPTVLAPLPVAAAPSRGPANAADVERTPVLSPAPKGGGWLAVAVAITVRIFENGVLLGSSETPRVMLPSGAHTLEFRNDDLGFRDIRKVQIAEGKTLALSLPLPRSVLHVNALPWAEVTINGTRAGETPIGNYALPIGTYQVVFTHPQYGERRQTVTVTAAAPARVSVDFTK
jgi:PEGA domain